MTLLALWTPAAAQAPRAPAPTAALDGHAPVPAAPAAPPQEVAFADVSGLVIVPLTLDGSRELRCILDTGMPEGAFLFDPALGAELGLEYAATALVNGTGGEQAGAGVALGRTLGLGTLCLPDERVLVLQERSPLAARGFDAVIGASLFQRFVVELDDAAGRVRLHDPASYQPPADAVALPLELEGTRPHVEAQLTLTADAAPRPVRLFVDTGATLELLLNAPALEGLALPPRTASLPVIEGVGGAVRGSFGRTHRLALGGLAVEGLLASLPEAAVGREAGTLGLGLLRQFRPALDYPGGRLLLRPLTRALQPGEFNMAGLVLRPREDGTRTIRDLLAGSPGAVAGLLPDDVLLAVDGRSVGAFTDRELRERFEQPGAGVQLTVERDGQRLQRRLTLRRLI